MPSVSNIAIGANMAAAAATKARHGMNESIARLSTGVRAMYGGDAAGYSMGQQTKAVSQSYAQATRNIEDAMSFAQQGESVLLEVANLAQRLRELAITADNAAILDANQEAALNSEAALIGDTITAVLDKTDFNTFEVVDSAAAKEYTIAYASLTANTTEVGPNVSIASQAGIANAAGAEANADAVLAGVAEGLGNLAADLTALKAHQGAASATSANMAAAGARLIDTDFALETASLTKNAILNQAALAMAAQANSAQSSILSVLQ